MIFRKKKNMNKRAPYQQPSKRAPIMRYYKPELRPRNNTQQSKSNNYLPQENTNKLKLARFPIILFRWGGVIAIIIIFIANLTLSQTAIKIRDNSHTYRSQQVYKDGINEVFSESWLNRSKLTLNSTKIESEIAERFPEIENSTVIIPLVGRKLQVGLNFVEPLSRLQGIGNSQAVLGENGNILIVDTNQKINSQFAELPLIVLPNITLEAGSRVLTSEEISLIKLSFAELDGSDSYRYKIKSIEYDIKSREIRIRFDSVPFFAKLTPERTPREQIGSLIASLKYMQEQGVSPSEYVDVRVDDRVFIK